MELSNDFRVGVPPQDAWKVLTDVERIAPHLPGAQLQEIEGEEYRGIVKVKVGPITAQYKGAATFLERDEAAGRVVLRASGRDTRGQGNANATITALLEPDGEGTKVTVKTDLTVTGKVAQFGRGVMADVSTKLLGQFVDALEADLRDNGANRPSAPSGEASTNGAAAKQAEAAPAAAETAAAPGAQPAQAAESAAAPAGAGVPSAPSAPSATPGAAAPSSGPRKITGPEAKPVDLFEAAGGPLAKRLIPLLGLVAVAVAVILWRRSRRS